MAGQKSNLATQVRTSAAGVKLGRQLFTQGVSGLDPVSVTNTLRSILSASGYQIPKDVIIPLDVAQVVMAGGTFVSALDTAKDIKSVCVPGAGALKASTLLLTDLGVLGQDASQILTLGADAAMVIASAGLDVLADISLLFDVLADLNPAAFSEKVKAAALSDYNDAVKYIVNPQKIKAASIIANYSKGNINVFEAMGEIAQTAPATFFNYFPDLGNYIPSFMQEVSIHKEETSWWGDHSAYDVRGFIRNVTNNQELVEDGILEKYLINPMQVFYKQNLNGRSLSVDAMACLAMMTQNTKQPLSKISKSWSAIPYIWKYKVTPFILGDEQVFEGIFTSRLPNKNNIPYDNDFIQVPKVLTQEGGITVNGVQQYTKEQLSVMATREELILCEKRMMALDQNGDIETLSTIPIARQMLKQWASPTMDLIISDYWQGLSISQQIKAAPYFKAGPVDVAKYDYLGDIDAFEKRYNYFHQFVIAKGLNYLAYNNIARYLGVSADKIVMRGYTPQGLGMFKTA